MRLPFEAIHSRLSHTVHTFSMIKTQIAMKLRSLPLNQIVYTCPSFDMVHSCSGHQTVHHHNVDNQNRRQSCSH